MPRLHENRPSTGYIGRSEKFGLKQAMRMFKKLPEIINRHTGGGSSLQQMGGFDRTARTNSITPVSRPPMLQKRVPFALELGSVPSVRVG